MEYNFDDYRSSWDYESPLWWDASTALNRIFMGDCSEPLCSRVYRQRRSAFRTAYLRIMDIVFFEKNHCQRVHRRWITIYALTDTCEYHFAFAPKISTR